MKLMLKNKIYTEGVCKEVLLEWGPLLSKVLRFHLQAEDI